MSVTIKCSVYLDVKANRFVLSMWKFPKSLICESPVPIPHQTEWGAPNEMIKQQVKETPKEVLHHWKQNEIMEIIVIAYHAGQNNK